MTLYQVQARDTGPRAPTNVRSTRKNKLSDNDVKLPSEETLLEFAPPPLQSVKRSSPAKKPIVTSAINAKGASQMQENWGWRERSNVARRAEANPSPPTPGKKLGPN